METRKYRSRTTCLSCGSPVNGIAVIVATGLTEDGGAERAFMSHEGCQNAIILDVPFRNSVDLSDATGRPRL